MKRVGVCHSSGVDQLAKLDRLVGEGCVEHAGSEPTGPDRAHESVVVAEVAECADETDQPLALVVVEAELGRASRDPLGRELGDVAADVGGDLHLANRLPATHRRVPTERHSTLVDLDLERDREGPAVAEHRRVMTGDARRPEVEVEPGVEPAALGAVELADLGSAACGPVAAPEAGAGLDQHDVKAERLELVGRAQPGDPGAQDRDADAARSLEGDHRQLGRRRPAGQCAEDRVDGREPARLPDEEKKLPTGQTRPAQDATGTVAPILVRRVLESCDLTTSPRAVAHHRSSTPRGSTTCLFRLFSRQGITRLLTELSVEPFPRRWRDRLSRPRLGRWTHHPRSPWCRPFTS